MDKKTLIFSVLLIVVASGSFYGGMVYGKNSASSGMRGDFSKFNPEDRQARAQQLGNGSTGKPGQGVFKSGAGFTSGEILSKDDKSITLKLIDGGSKIILFSDSTQIMKSDSGSINDLEIGGNITANGAVNSDGSITAESIQTRPKMEIPPVQISN